MVIIFLLIPLTIYCFTIVYSIFNGNFMKADLLSLLLSGILLGLYSLGAFATFIGNRLGQGILVLLVTTILVLFSSPLFNNNYPSHELIEHIGTVAFFFVLPIYLLFLPAPSAFLKYQREKKSRHLTVLEEQLNRIGSDE